MPELQLLHVDHTQALLTFELDNRAYFAAAVPDRGDAYFDEFEERLSARLREQEAGICAFYVLADEDGSVLGRFNLVDIEDGTADLGYRVAEHVAGHGVATTTVRKLCRLATEGHGLRALRAAAADRNPASHKVLTNVGFRPVGPADPEDLSGSAGTVYRLDLA